MQKHSNQKGRTALEMFFVLVILGIIATGIYGMIANVFARRAQTETVYQIQNLVEDIKGKFAWRGPNSASGYTVSVTGGIGQYLSNEKIIKGYTDGYITSKAGTKIGFASDASSFTIKMEGLPRSLCVVLLTSNWGDELVDWSISSSSTASWQKALNKRLPQSMSAAQTSCNTNNKYVLLKFK